MKKLLVVEDDSYKSEAILNVINQHLNEPSIELAEDVSTAIRHINQKVYDLIVIDMSLPSHPVAAGGGSPLSLLSGGLEILFELNALNRTDKCVIVTQYPEVEMAGKLITLKDAPKEIFKNYSCNVMACIHYFNGDNKWQEEMKNIIINL